MIQKVSEIFIAYKKKCNSGKVITFWINMASWQSITITVIVTLSLNQIRNKYKVCIKMYNFFLYGIMEFYVIRNEGV